MGSTMAHGARIGSAVMFVQDLDRSVTFYREVLALEVRDRTDTAALLEGDGSQLILRSMGSGATHPLGAVGVQLAIVQLRPPHTASVLEPLANALAELS
jgi:catechol 2,3-dioxygenase-like lactoylglutathione lyase family enzyme